MSAPTGILTQPAASVLEDVDEFFFGYLPWYHGSVYNADRSRLIVTMTDPDEDEGDNETTKTYELSAQQIKDAFATAKQKRYHLCCEADIADEQLGLGCAQDLDIILQVACYDELVFG